MKLLRATLVSFVLLTLLTGVIYPLAITVIAKVAFPEQAEGSLVDRDGKPTTSGAAAVGSRLIGQTFDLPHYFWSRPSKTSPMAYNAAASSGSNTGPSAIAPDVQARVETLRRADVGNTAPIPIDLVTASGSGLDPHISLAAADYQVPRIARLRRIDPSQLRALVLQHCEGRDLGVLGEPVVNVLLLNIALDHVAPYTVPATIPGAATMPAGAPAR